MEIIIKISLVLATVGRADDVKRLFDSLAVQTSTAFEVIVVDQNADDRLIEHVDEARRTGIDVQHVRLSKPNLALARNAGISCAKYEIIAFPDDDCWYERDVVSSVLSSFEVDSKLDGLVVDWVEQSKILPLSPSKCDGFCLTWTDWSRFRGGQASSICLFLRASLLVAMGGFDPRLGVGQWYGAAEETDLIMRALRRGALLRRFAGARVHHAYSTVSGDFLWENAPRTMRRARGTGALYAKHRLSSWVIIRGIASPPLIYFLDSFRVSEIVRGFLVSAGRLQGAISWFLRER